MSLCYPYLGDGEYLGIDGVHHSTQRLLLINTGVTSYREVCGFPAFIEGYLGLLPVIPDCQSLANSAFAALYISSPTLQ